MDEHDRGALIQDFQHGVEAGIAQKMLAVARKQRDTGELERIKRIGDLLERILHAAHRHRAESTEALGPARDELGGVVVATPCQRPRACLAGEADAGLAGEGPSVVLLHEMGGTLDSWDGISPALSQRFRTLRYDQRGSGLSEKVRQPITTELLVDDLEAVLQGSALTPPYHFVTVAAATMQALIYMTRHPERIASFVFCNPFTGADPSRVAALEERAGLAEREGMRTAIPVTLDKSLPANIG